MEELNDGSTLHKCSIRLLQGLVQLDDERRFQNTEVDFVAVSVRMKLVKWEGAGVQVLCHAFDALNDNLFITIINNSKEYTKRDMFTLIMSRYTLTLVDLT